MMKEQGEEVHPPDHESGTPHVQATGASTSNTRKGLVILIAILCVVMVVTQREHLHRVWEYRKVTLPLMVGFMLYAWISGRSKVAAFKKLKTRIMSRLTQEDTCVKGLSFDELTAELKLTSEQIEPCRQAIHALIAQGDLKIKTMDGEQLLTSPHYVCTLTPN